MSSLRGLCPVTARLNYLAIRPATEGPLISSWGGGGGGGSKEEISNIGTV